MKLIYALLLLFIPSLANANVFLVASPGSVYLTGTVGQFSGSSFVTVFNDGNEVAKSVMANSFCFGNFQVSNMCFGDLRPGQSCSLIVNFQPQTAGFSSCSINVNSMNGGFVSIMVQGQANAPIIEESEL